MFIRREFFNTLVFLQLAEEFLKGLFENGVDKIGFDLGQRDENELALVKTRVRNNEFFRVNLLVIEKEKVEIDHPGAPAKRLPSAEA